MGCCVCLVHMYDCLRAWNNPRSICYAPWSKSRLDCHEYYYQEFLKKELGACGGLGAIDFGAQIMRVVSIVVAELRASAKK
eukprot:CAMPEP_0113821778 /NCGR_PEP_ID=MMETSP0328-20130328/1910_1 /TAXON_ID=39455 /ORGANISM="Alexandrium minutum" /LENGTH=80 /DNA_ID=CAMNT_0000789713 /DNA_START=109 /DNA_END=349 /DNA_ORIENTATION=+ /assembly_acc=CAM_ASM_000350